MVEREDWIRVLKNIAVYRGNRAGYTERIRVLIPLGLAAF